MCAIEMGPGVGRGADPYWMDNTLRFSALTFNSFFIAVMAGLQRLVLDKHWTGLNAQKGIKNLTEKAVAGECIICGQLDSQQHWMVECQEPGLMAERRSCVERLVELRDCKCSNDEHLQEDSWVCSV